MISRYEIRRKGKALAQDGGPGNTPLGVQLVLNTTDWDTGILQALRIFDQDRPNIRVVDQVVAATGFRFVLAGTGVLSGLAGLDSWQDGFSTLQQVFSEWSTADQNRQPMDGNSWRIVRDPGGTIVLEWLESSALSGSTIRLQFTARHQLTEAPNTVANPTVAAVAALSDPVAAGNVDNGNHSWVYTWITAQGETIPSPATGVLAIADKTVNGQVAITIPYAGADQGVIGAKVYRSQAGDVTPRKLVGTFYGPGGGGVFVDNVADASLGAQPPATNTAGGQNSVLDTDEEPLAILTASMFLQMAAVKAAQNTGNSGLPNDVVDRRSQSDIFRSRAKEYRDMYAVLVGKGPASDIAPASGIRDLDVESGSGLGFLWHTASRR